jgi:hypothetical protein
VALVEQVARDDGADRLGQPGVVTDGMAEQQRWRCAIHQQPLRQAVAGVALEVCRQFDGFLQHVALQARQGRQGTAGRHQILQALGIPALGDDLGVAVEVDDEVEVEVAEHVDVEFSST